MKTDLKPCPICGGEDTEIVPGIRGDWYVGCLPCNYQIRVADCTEEETIRYWNTRPIEDALKAEVERLKQALSDIANIGFEGKIGDKVARETMRRIANSVSEEKGGEDE